MNPIELAILDLFRERGPMVGRDIVAELRGFDCHCVSRLLLEMALDLRLTLTSDIRLTLPPGGYLPKS